MMKRKICICGLVCCILMTLIPIHAKAETARFTDISGHPEEAAIIALVERGVFQETGDLFRPDDPIKRSELAAVLDYLLDYSEKSDIAGFSDVDAQSRYAPALLRLNAAGILLGADGKLRPEDFATRQEAVVLIARAFKLETTDAKISESGLYTDYVQIAQWAVDSVIALCETGAISDSTDGSFRPADSITRAEFASMLYRVMTFTDSVAYKLTKHLRSSDLMVGDELVKLMYRYFRQHPYELSMLPTFSEEQEPNWDELTLFAMVNYFNHNRPARPEDYSMTADTLASTLDCYFIDFSYTDASSAYMTYESGIYTPVPGDTMRSGYYRLLDITQDAEGIYTATYDGMFFKELETSEAYDVASPNVKAIRDAAHAIDELQRDAFEDAILSIFLEDDYDITLAMAERVTVRFVLSDDSSFPFRYLSCEIADASVPNTGFRLSEPVALDDMDVINATFIEPLYYLGNQWFYNWDSPSALHPDDLLIMLGMGNYLGLPRNVGGMYIEPQASASKVEAMLFKRFGVSAEQLRASELYDEANHTYTLIGDGGGGWNAVAISARQADSFIYIEVGIEWMFDERPLEPGEIRLDPQGILTPKGTLKVALANGYIQFISFALYEDSTVQIE